MICTSIAEKSVEAVLASLQGVSFAEIRLEALADPLPAVPLIFSRDKRLIATARPGRLAEEERVEILMAAIRAGASFVDVELETGEAFFQRIADEAMRAGCQCIVSYHNHERTPAAAKLARIKDALFERGAAIAKIACRVRELRDNARLMALVDDDRPVIALGMGSKGVITRIASPLLGSPFTFASSRRGKETAEGQLDATTLTHFLTEIADASS